MILDRVAMQAVMTMSEFKQLYEYSTSLPTGQTPGKVWKSQDRQGEWWLREYEAYPEDHPDHGKFIKINTFELCIDTGGENVQQG